MASAISANRAELIAIANSVATEKMIDKSIVIEAMEEAIQKSARNRYGAENDIRAKLDPAYRRSAAVARGRSGRGGRGLLQAGRSDRRQKASMPKPSWAISSSIRCRRSISGRIDAQSAKQVIFQKVRDAERDRQYEEFKDRAGEVVTGVIKSVEFGHVIVNLGRAEGVIRRDQQIPREAARVGERVRALDHEGRTPEPRPADFPEPRASRIHEEAVRAGSARNLRLNIIEIKAAARDPGSRAKIGVISRDSSIDPVGACVGMKGSRVQAVVQELQGEKIDIIPWSEDTATFVVNALQPATVSRVVIDEEEKPHRSGRARRSAERSPSVAAARTCVSPRQLTGSAIDIMTEQEASEKRQKRIRRAFEDVRGRARRRRDAVAACWWPKASPRLEEVAYIDMAELASIEGFDDELARGTAKPRAGSAGTPRGRQPRSTSRLGVEDALAELPHLTEAMLVTLGKAGIKTLDDLADLATDELIAKKRVEQRRRDNSPPRPAPRREREPRRQGRRAGRIWPERRTGQRDHHGRARPLVR